MEMVANNLKIFSLMTMCVLRLSLVSNNLAAANDFANGEEAENFSSSNTDESPLFSAEISCARHDVLGGELKVLQCGGIADSVDQRFEV